MKKSSIYAAFGIQYKGGKILAPVFGWIAPLLINGNAKLGAGVWTWSMLPGTGIFTAVINGREFSERGTCPCNCPGCYAQTGFYRMPSTVRSLVIKTYLARHHVDFMMRAIMAQIIADGIQTIRVHAAGDFCSPEYVDAWRAIAERFPGVVLWTYTKTEYETSFDGVDNFNVVRSLVPGCGLNYGHAGYIADTAERLQAAGERVHVCRCGIDPEQHCNACTACAECKYVLFLEHSTAYRAEQDADLPRLRELIEKQPR